MAGRRFPMTVTARGTRVNSNGKLMSLNQYIQHMMMPTISGPQGGWAGLTNQPGSIWGAQTPNQRQISTLRRRMYGDPVGEFMDEHAGVIRKILQDDSEHQRLSIRHGWHTATDEYRITIVCHACERKWTKSVTAEMSRHISADRWEREFVRDLVAPLVETVTKATCFGVNEGAILAEWLTRRLAQAGAKGMPYVQVVHEAVAARLCSPKDVDGVLRAMDFVPEWVTLANSGVILPGGWDGSWTLPILHLPSGHPLHTW